MPKLITSVYQK